MLRRSGLIGVECDTPEGLEQILALELPTTVTVQSSAPYKLHFWFRPPNGNTDYAAFRLERAGVSADKGRYLLCPPALHPSGAVYAFLREPPETDIATLPQSRYDELVRLAVENRQQLRSQLSSNPEAKISEGQRRETIFRFACSQRAYGGHLRRSSRPRKRSIKSGAYLRSQTTTSPTRCMEHSSTNRRRCRRFLFRHL